MSNNRKRKRGGLQGNGKWVSPYRARLMLVTGTKPDEIVKLAYISRQEERERAKGEAPTKEQ